MAHATALIENEGLEQRINALLAEPTLASGDDAAANTVRMERIRTEELRAADRTSQIIAQADKLRAEVEAAKRDIEERKKKVAARREDLGQVSNGIGARRSRQLEDTERSIQMLRYKWNRSFESMAATRSFLSFEAARLYGLRRIRKSSKYELGGIEMIELPAMIRTYSFFSTPSFHLHHANQRPRCLARGHLDLTCAYRPHTDTGFALSGYPTTGRNHTPPSRLPETDGLLFGFLTPPWRSTISGHRRNTYHFIYRPEPKTYPPTSATVYRQAIINTGKGRPIYLLTIHRGRGAFGV